MAEDGRARRPALRIVGHLGWKTGRDDKMSSVFVQAQDGRTGRLGTLNEISDGGWWGGVVVLWKFMETSYFFL